MNSKKSSEHAGLIIPALVMAGGRGKRIGVQVEKPLLTLLRRPLVEWVAAAVESANRISGWYVITSENTLETEKYCESRGFQVVRTDAKGYHEDLKQAISKIGISSAVMTVSSDLPALTGEFLDKVVLEFGTKGADALTVLVPVEKRKQIGLSTSSVYPFEGKDYCVSGINIINGKKISANKLSEKAIISEDIEAVLNVNTLNDLLVAERILASKKAT